MRLLLDESIPCLDLIASDEASLLAVERGEAPMTWRVAVPADEALVLGTAGRFAVEIDLDRARELGVEVLRRPSGGGAVWLWPGCLTWSCAVRYEDAPEAGSIRGAYAFALGRVSAALASLDIPARVEENDLAARGRRLGGSAQRRLRRACLVHGTVIVELDAGRLARMGELLAEPAAAGVKAPAYRAGRSHAAFLTGAREAGCPLSPRELAARLGRALVPGAGPGEPSGAEREEAGRLARERFGAASWRLRR